MSGFNLVNEEWIPCRMRDGTHRDFGLRDVLLQANDIREIFDPSPLVTVALHRLLLAILHRNFGPESLEEWKGLWGQGQWHAKRLQAYYEKWHNRFNLFDNVKPFYQQAAFSTKKETPVKRLAFEFAAQNNATLFDHSTDDKCSDIAPAVAARWLVTCHSFAPSAGKSETIHTKDSPWSRGAVVLLQGDNLFETLALNLLNMFVGDFPTVAQDIPEWESTQNFVPEHNVTPSGLLEYLSLQSRWVHLLPSSEGCVNSCYFAQGRALREDFRSDPMLAYKRDTTRGLLVWTLDEHRAVWRDSHALLHIAADAPFQLPRAFNRTAILVRDNVLDRRRQFQLCVIGQCLEHGQPRIHFWRHERLPLPLAYLNNKDLLSALKKSLDIAENIGKQLSCATWRLARLVLAPDESKQPNKNQKQDINKLADHLAPGRVYWSQLEVPFKRLLVELPDEKTKDENGAIQYGATAAPQWAEQLRRAAFGAFADACSGLDRNARTLKAVTKAEYSFHLRVHGILKPVFNEGREVTHEPTE